MIHVSEFDARQGETDTEVVVDRTIKMRIIKLSPTERKIGLSVRALKSDDYESNWQNYASSESPEVTLGDHFKHRRS